jgi:methionyl-tRNA synthetase
VNADLVGKVVNIASRCAVFTQRSFNNRLSATLPDVALYDSFVAQRAAIAAEF